MVASSIENQRDEFTSEKVNSESYQNRHMGMIFEDGFSFSGFERDKAWLRDGDSFLDVSMVSGADDENDGRALVLADFDDDGDLDYFVHNIQKERHRLYRNDAPEGTGHRSVKIRLRGTAGPAEAMGAVVRATVGDRTVAQIMAYGSGFLSQNAPELVFGVGAADEAEVSVRWPGREEETFGSMAAGGTYLLVEGSGRPTSVPRKPFRFDDPTPPGLQVKVGDVIDGMALLDADLAPVRLNTTGLKRPLLVNFWASYCAACIQEMPDLQALGDAGEMDVVLVNVDTEDKRDRAVSILEKKGITLPRYFVTEGAFRRLFDPARLPLPTTLLIAEDGTLEEVHQAPISLR